MVENKKRSWRVWVLPPDKYNRDIIVSLRRSDIVAPEELDYLAPVRATLVLDPPPRPKRKTAGRRTK